LHEFEYSVKRITMSNINPKATYKIGRLRSDSRPSDPDPTLIQPKILPGTSFTGMGIMNWQQFFTVNPLGYKNNTSLDVFQVMQRGELKHVYSGTILTGFGNEMGMNYGGNGYNPTPIGGNGLGNPMPGNGFGMGRGMMPQSDQMSAVFSHAELQMQNQQTRHEAEIDRITKINDDLRIEITRQMERASKAEADWRVEREARIKAENELDKVRNDFTLKDQYRKQAEDDAVKLANEKLALDKKQSSALNDGSLDNIMKLIVSGTEFLKVANGQPTQNTMQPSIKPQNTYGAASNGAPTNGVGDAAKTANNAPPFQKSSVMTLPNNGQAPRQTPHQPFAKIEYK
jgi:hypothetical protein